MSKSEITERILRRGVVAVLRLRDDTKALHVIEALVRGGIDVVEITMTMPNATAVVEKARRAFASSAIVGVGSVLDVDTAELALGEGAQFVVSPVLKPEIIWATHQHDAPAIPGAFTPTEILGAHESGADIVKVFPADVLGTAFIKALLAPMPHLRLMPTGGVTLENAGSWLEAGAGAVGIGTALLDPAAIRDGRYNDLTERATLLVKNIEEARRQH
jgi:2-dehydro-3-deoxyphosphogluconate aldolase/(4S)-4-hydroxy-2-oxoglutarate aldolase